MPTYLHLAKDMDSEPKFMQPITNPIEEEINDEFEYDDHYYFQLNEKARKDFEYLKLKKGKYVITQKYYTKDGYWIVVMNLKQD